MFNLFSFYFMGKMCGFYDWICAIFFVMETEQKLRKIIRKNSVTKAKSVEN